MANIPLVDNNDKNSINTSVIAIKKEIEQIEDLLQNARNKLKSLFDNDFLYRSDLTDTVESGNKNPVTSNGVYQAIQSSALTVDTAMSNTSTNAVQNKVIKEYVDTAETNAKNLANATGTLAVAHGGTGQTSLDNVTVGVSKNTSALDKYVTCSTGASTAAKTVTLTGFTLVKGAKLIVYLENANTAQSALTLNVNSTGAKTIRWNGSVTSATVYAMTAGYYNCYYDGTYWCMESSFEAKNARESNFATSSCKSRARQTFTCSTGASTVAKAVSVGSYTLGTRDEVLIYFSNANTASNPTLNVNSTGAKPIKVFGTSPNSTNKLLGVGTYYCQYDGTNWNCYPYGLTNGITAGNMQSVTSDAVAKALDYSTSEVNTGTKWRDGRPIYRKYQTCSLNISTNTWTDTNMSNSGINWIVDIRGYNSGGTMFNLYGARDSGNYIRVLSTRPSQVDITGFVIEYTKTADTATV